MPVASNVFTRIWKFVDQYIAGDYITRAAADIALDDAAEAINVALAREIGFTAWDASAGTFPTTTDRGGPYFASVAGTVDSIVFSVGDILYSLVASPSTSTYAANWKRIAADVLLADAQTSAEALTALGIDAEFTSIANMLANADNVVGRYVWVRDGYQGQPELFRISAAASYTANTATVYNLTGATGQAVSQRRWFAASADVIADTRGYADFPENIYIQVLGIKEVYKALASGGTGDVVNSAAGTPVQWARVQQNSGFFAGIVAVGPSTVAVGDYQFTNLAGTQATYEPLFAAWGEGLDGSAALLRASHTTSVGAPQIALEKSGGTIAAPAAVAINEVLGSVTFAGFDAANYVQGAAIQAVVRATPGTNDMPADLEFMTTSDGGAAATVRWAVAYTGFLVPFVDNTYDIGTISQRVKAINAYTLNLATANGITVDGEVLPIPAWRQVGATIVASGDTTIEIDLDISTYSRFKIIIENAIPASDAQDFFLRTSTNGGGTYDSGASDYSWGYHKLFHDGSNTSSQNSSSASIGIADNVGSAANEFGVSIEIDIHAPGGAAYSSMSFKGLYADAIGGINVNVIGSGVRKSAADIDSLQFRFGSGNVESGTFVVLGQV